MIVRGYILSARALVIAATLLAVRPARAAGDLDKQKRLYLRLATGVAFDHESWSPSGGSAGAVHFLDTLSAIAEYTFWRHPSLHLCGAWSIGVLGRLTFYRFGSDSAPPASSLGLVPAALVTFTR